MSQYFDLGPVTLWNPSSGASRLFRRQLEVFEAELGIPSGIGPMVADECQLDPNAFRDFVNALLERHLRTRHTVINALSEGFIATTLVLAERAGIALDQDTDSDSDSDSDSDKRMRADHLWEKARDLGHHMAR